MRFLVVINESGNIVAAAHASTERDANRDQTGFFPLPGQTIVELDVPAELSQMEPQERLRSIFKYRVHPDGSRLESVTRS